MKNKMKKTIAIAALIASSQAGAFWGFDDGNGLGDGLADGNFDFSMSGSSRAHTSTRGYGYGYNAPYYGYGPYYAAPYGAPATPMAQAVPASK